MALCFTQTVYWLTICCISSIVVIRDRRVNGIAIWSMVCPWFAITWQWVTRAHVPNLTFDRRSAIVLRRAPDIRRENNGRFGSGRFGTDVSVRPGAMIACLDTTTYHPSVIFCDRSSGDTDRDKARPRLWEPNQRMIMNLFRHSVTVSTTRDQF